MVKYDIVGKIFQNKKGYQFKVLQMTGRDCRSVARYDVMFIATGNVVHDVTSGHIRSGEVKDRMAPSVFGVGCLGDADGYATRKGSRRLYYTWRNMIRRCYDPTFRKYEFYGGRGIKVCERWHRLDKFIEDIKVLPGYDEVLFEQGAIE